MRSSGRSKRSSATGRSAGAPTGNSWSGTGPRDDDGSESAFEVLVMRHGPMVFRVCRDLLDDPHDAQDAFQATFLVLARKVRFDPAPRLGCELALRGRPAGRRQGKDRGRPTPRP